MASIYFRDGDRELVAFLKFESATPEGYSLKGNVIRDRLYDYMELKGKEELRQMAKAKAGKYKVINMEGAIGDE